MRIRFTYKAKNKLKAIYQYYKDKSLGKFGRQVRVNIIKKTLQLKDFPYLGQMEHQLEELGMEYRYLVEGNYKIIYRVEANDIIIANIFDTRQNPENILD